MCLDETSKQLIIETRAPIPAKPGQPARHDYEYERNGVANLFMVFAPLEGWRHVKVTDRHTAIDYAHVLRDCPTRIFPTRPKSCWCRIISASTSQPRSMRPFPRPRPAGSIERFEWHYTGKHGSRLRPWPIRTSAFLRVGNVWIAASLTSESSPTKVTAWQDHRNKRHARADWRCATANATPFKLKRLYPQFRVAQAD